MTLVSEKIILKRRLITAIFIPAIVGILMIMSYFVAWSLGSDFHKAGIFPRQLERLPGIFTIVFVHADLSHLLNNLISFLLISTALCFFYREISTKVLLFSYFFSGLLLWVIGRESWHVGASGLIYSLAFFLFFSGLIRKYTPLIAISFVVAFIYGSMVWHLFPWQINDPISWEGHLSGGFVGTVLSFIYRKQGPQSSVVEWQEDKDDEEVDYEFIEDELDEENDSSVKNENVI